MSRFYDYYTECDNEESNSSQEVCGWWAEGGSYDTSEEGSYYDTPEWCSCGECEEMEETWEQNCCHSHDRVTENMSEYDVNCITYHPGFPSVVLDPFVLETAYYSYRRGKYRRGKISNSERQ